MMFFYQCLNLSLAKKRKDPDPFLGIGILGIEPELIELIGSGPLRIKPNISLFSFTKFTSISLFYEGAGKCKCLAACLAPDQFAAGSDIPPLITSTHLEFAVHVLI